MEEQTAKVEAPVRPQLHYTPLPHVKQFHESTAHECWLVGGYGAGKTHALVHEALRLAAVNPGCTGLLTEPTYRMVRDILLPHLMRALTASGVPFQLKLSELTVLLPGGAKILLRSRENAERLLGHTLAWAGADEITIDRDDRALRALLSRLREPRAKQTKMFGVGTPEGFNWFYRQYVEHGAPEGAEVIYAPTARNAFLPHGYRARLMRRLPKALVPAYLDGKFVPLGVGRVYDAFDPQKNATRMEYEPHVDLLWAHDFNVDPLCSVVAQRRTRPDGVATYVVVGEIVLTGGATAGDAAREFLARYGARHAARVALYGDASGGKRDTRGNTTDFHILREELAEKFGGARVDLRVNRNNPPLKASIQAVNALCENGRGLRRLFINAGAAPQTLRSLLGVTYDENGMPKKDGGEHLADALRYLCFREQPLLKPRVRVVGVDEPRGGPSGARHHRDHVPRRDFGGGGDSGATVRVVG